MKVHSLILVLGLLAPLTFAQPQFPTDPKTGRAIGAKQIAPEELRRHIDQKTKTLVIDVRDREEFEKETITGAINIPLAELEPKLKDIPKDTALVFT